MSRREEQLRKMRDQKISERVSNIYLSSITEVLFEAGVKKEDIETLLCNLTEKIENLTKGYIGLDTYIETVEEKVGIKLKGDLAESVKNALATTKSAGMEAVETVFTEIAKALAEGNTVEISGFGKFEVTERSARTGINPATKEKIEIPASKSVKFKPSKALKDQVK